MPKNSKNSNNLNTALPGDVVPVTGSGDLLPANVEPSPNPEDNKSLTPKNTGGDKESSPLSLLTSPPLSLLCLLPILKALSHRGVATPLAVTELPVVPINVWSDPPLRQASQNWSPWSVQMKNMLRSYKALTYIQSMDNKPSATDGPLALANWNMNHSMICSFILSTIDIKEMVEFTHIDNVHILWSKLVATYDIKGPASKVNSLFCLLSSPFSWGLPMTEQYCSLIEHANGLYNDGLSTKDDIILYSLLWNLNTSDTAKEFRQARTILASNCSASHNDIYNFLLHTEQARVCLISPLVDSALSAGGSGTPAGCPPPLKGKKQQHGPCNNCHKPNHEKEFCIKPGGGMAGKTIQEARAAQGKVGKFGKKGLHPFQLDGKSYVMDKAGAVFCMTKTNKPAIIPDNSEHLASIVFDSMCLADIIKLANTSVDPISDYTSTADLCGSAVLYTHNFLLDSGCTVHMSPLLSDFMAICPISGQRIRGVNGSIIKAKGIGDISLSVHGDASPLLLKDALFIPGTTVHLISVSCLIRDLCGSVVFDSDHASILNSDGVTLATGSCAPGSNLWSLDSSANFDLTHAALPDLKTWHRCLGHANNQAIHDMFTKGLATGMRVDLSRSPPKCDHCILGKQVRTPVQKVQSTGRCSCRLGIVYVDLTGPQAVVSVTNLA